MTPIGYHGRVAQGLNCKNNLFSLHDCLHPEGARALRNSHESLQRIATYSAIQIGVIQNQHQKCRWAQAELNVAQ
jgi:hypothetical protein